jgi:hypothetical protein
MKIYTSPLSANPVLAASLSGTLQNPGAALDWFSITFFNPTTDLGSPPTTATDLYIRSLEITGPAAAGINGDFNSDGKVDAGDYDTWRKNNGTNNALANDNGLGTPISVAHYNLWRQNFGKPPGAGSSLSGSAVPEPGTFVLLIAAGAGAITIGTRRASTRRRK